MKLSVRLFSTALLLLLVLLAPEMEMVAEARTCESQSHKFKGTCISKSNCAHLVICDFWVLWSFCLVLVVGGLWSGVIRFGLGVLCFLPLFFLVVDALLAVPCFLLLQMPLFGLGLFSVPFGFVFLLGLLGWVVVLPL
ncbi:hypothetical protein QYF36_004518 [Acer negundo]|nr:hypothetical protein QYF36_004518 [Acer negundo]